MADAIKRMIRCRKCRRLFICKQDVWGNRHELKIHFQEHHKIGYPRYKIDWQWIDKFPHIEIKNN